MNNVKLRYESCATREPRILLSPTDSLSWSGAAVAGTSASSVASLSNSSNVQRVRWRSVHLQHRLRRIECVSSLHRTPLAWQLRQPPPALICSTIFWLYSLRSSARSIRQFNLHRCRARWHLPLSVRRRSEFFWTRRFWVHMPTFLRFLRLLCHLPPSTLFSIPVTSSISWLVTSFWAVRSSPEMNSTVTFSIYADRCSQTWAWTSPERVEPSWDCRLKRMTKIPINRDR